NQRRHAGRRRARLAPGRSAIFRRRQTVVAIGRRLGFARARKRATGRTHDRRSAPPAGGRGRERTARTGVGRSAPVATFDAAEERAAIAARRDRGGDEDRNRGWRRLL